MENTERPQPSAAVCLELRDYLNSYKPTSTAPLSCTALFEEWGAWAAGSGIQGYATGKKGSGRQFHLSDDAYVEVDQTISEVTAQLAARTSEAQAHREYRLFEMFYRQDMDCGDILSLVARKRSYRVNYQTDYGKWTRGLNVSIVMWRIELFGKLVYQRLQAKLRGGSSAQL